ncbi:MAG TPA: hypothetical protein VMA32_07590 [Streptosporangiaceae bacterium]|nr:hypothetical protein [Streptosporangiaceae bacterium]
MATEIPEAAKQDRARVLWHLRDDDKRLLFITTVGAFIGGLAANIGLVLTVGLGLLIAHHIRNSRDALHALLTGLEVLAAIFLAPSLVVLLLAYRTRTVRQTARDLLTRLLLPAGIFFAVVLLLALIGHAAGLK